MQLDVLNRQGNFEKSLDVSDSIFDAKFNNTLVHQVAVAYRAGGRAGTHSGKNRSAVRGGGAKPYKQKGMGRARAGTRSSPIFRGGGQTFAKSPRDYSQKVNRKSYRAAMRSVLSETRRLGNLIVVNDMDLETHKTKDALKQLQVLNCESVLIVDDNVSENLDMATRNLPHVHVIAPSMLNLVDVIDIGKVLMTESAIKYVDEWL